MRPVTVVLARGVRAPLLMVHAEHVPDLVHHVANVTEAVAPAQVDHTVRATAGKADPPRITAVPVLDHHAHVRLWWLPLLLHQVHAGLGSPPGSGCAEGLLSGVVDAGVEVVPDNRVVLPVAPGPSAGREPALALQPGAASRTALLRPAVPQPAGPPLNVQESLAPSSGRRGGMPVILFGLLLKLTAQHNAVYVGYVAGRGLHERIRDAARGVVAGVAVDAGAAAHRRILAHRGNEVFGPQQEAWSGRPAVPHRPVEPGGSAVARSPCSKAKHIQALAHTKEEAQAWRRCVGCHVVKRQSAPARRVA
mmetsp:Transcript_54246/g.154523  ORF Transcript_54246/g.154523 Transcript_54246/m.154523 type:complete len:307 (+) Transcript_54246:372-1292(+)